MKIYALTIAFTVISVSSLDYKVDLHKSLVRCENKSFWLPVNVNYIVDASLQRNGISNAFKSSSHSCASFTIAFSTGYLEFSVFVQTVSNGSGFRIIVHKDIENKIVYEYRRFSKEFTAGWKRFSIPTQKNIDHITVLGFSGTDDIVLLETIRYIITTSDENDTGVDLRTNSETIINQNKKNNCYKISESDAKNISITRKINLNDLARKYTYVGNDNGIDNQDDNENIIGNKDIELDENNNQGGKNGQGEDNILNSINDINGQNNSFDVNEGGDNNLVSVNNKGGGDNQDGDDNQEGNDNQGSDDNQEGYINQGKSDNQGGDNNEGNEENGIRADKEISTGTSFWNTWTITLVAVGSATVVALLCVGSYYIGKIRGNKPVITEETPEEDIEAPRVIPRVKSVYDSPTRFVSSLSHHNLSSNSRDTFSM